MARADTPSNFSDFLTISEAADFLGVSSATLRNWDRSGKLKPRRHPQNGYRIYLHEDLEAVLRSAESSLDAESLSPLVEWSKVDETDHFVLFYENDEYMIDSASGFVAASLLAGGTSAVAVTPEHADLLAQKLVGLGVDVSEAEATGRYVVLDVRSTLERFMNGRSIDSQRFDEFVGSAIGDLMRGTSRLHAFGEMASTLWMEGNHEAAIELERRWKNLSEEHHFPLLCVYPISGFSGGAIDDVCTCHTRIIPAESYALADTEDNRRRAITRLQQKAEALTAEIRHRCEVEKVLVHRERELVDFFENAIEGLHKVGADGTVLWANRADYELLGYQENEYVGQPITKFHADADVIAEILERLQRGDQLANFPARLKCKNGEIKHVLITSNACFEEGKFAYTRCFSRDVTEQHQAELSLLESYRRKDEFLATLSHELRNPLAPIHNALDLLTSDSTDERTRAKAQSIIKRQVSHLTRLVDDLLDLSRITRDKIEIRKEKTELASMITATLETCAPTIEAAGQQVKVDLPTQPILIEADPARMAQVFSNLLSNASKFTQPGGAIQLEARVEAQEVVARVRDNGIGIPCEELAHIFDMFRQLDQSLEKTHGGLGIGLTLVRRLVELHGGTVNAQSEGLGKGSEFIVRLPVMRDGLSSAPTPTAQKGKETAISTLRILVVDDNHDSGHTLCLLLQHRGHEVHLAGDGLEAIAMTEEFHPDIILMDVGMPKLNGYDATKRIRETPSGKDIMIVALTGWGQASDVARSIEAGCNAHLVKPVNFAELENLLATASKQ